MPRRLLSTLLALLCLLSCGLSRAAPAYGLTVDHAVDPLGIDARRPALSWKLGDTGRDAIQSAYQVQAAEEAGQLDTQRGLLWDSGVVRGSQSVHVPYNGAALRSAQRVHWRVRVWDRAGKPSAWSAPGVFETGLLDAADWRARWIGIDPPARASKAGPAVMLRKEFTLGQRVRRARLYITSLGMYDARINGTAVGDQVLRPGWTSYDKRLQYQTYDLTGELRQGTNAIAVTLGDGWYRGFAGFSGRDNYGTRRALLAELRVTLADGSEVVVATDPSWKAAEGPVRTTDLLMGETYDARLERTGWDRPGFDDRGWQAVQGMEPAHGTLVAQGGPPVRRVLELKPVKLLRTPQGDTVFDFGQNMVGWVRLRVRGPAGATVTLRHAEVLDRAGNFYTANLRQATQTDTYTLKGGTQEVYEPRFTFHGFRYVAVSGYPGEITLDALTGVVVHSDMGSPNSWTSSHPLLDKLVKNAEWSQRGNFVDVPTDCPQRNERVGWTGDAQVFARTASYNFDVASFFGKWLADLGAEQKPDGSIPFIIPDIMSRKHDSIDGAAGWSDAVTVIPWTMYQAYGDASVLSAHYGSMKKWVDHAARLAPDGVWKVSYQFGDWLSYQAPSSEARDYPGASTGKDLVATAYLAHSAGLLARVATVLGQPDDARRYGALAANVRQAFNREFVSATGRVGENTQTAYALALRFGLLAPELRAQAARRLADEVKARKGHLTTGFLGTPALLFALSDHGQIDTAYRLLVQDTYPSWLYPVKIGATTIWERWDGIKPDGSFQDPAMNSFNHYAYGAVVEWMYGVAAGIDTDPDEPGYKRSIIRPRPGGGLTHVRARVATPYGELVSAWEVRGSELHVSVRIPPNTRSTVVLPSAAPETVSLEGKPLALAGMRRQGGDLVLDIGSGEYSFVIQAPALAARLRMGMTYSTDDTLKVLIKDERTRAVLQRYAPALLAGLPGALRDRSLNEISAVRSALVDSTALATIAEELARIPTGSTQ